MRENVVLLHVDMPVPADKPGFTPQALVLTPGLMRDPLEEI